MSGVLTVARQEFRLRIRAGRWRWVLGASFVVLLGVTALIRRSVRGYQAYTSYTGYGPSSGGTLPDTPTPVVPPAGVAMFGGLMLVVLGLALLVVPALTSTSVNGDRERGTLATLQVTRLGPVQIAAGKLLAAWGTTLVFLALSLPMVGWAMTEGGVGVGRVLVTLAVVALLLGVVCAVSQALSALMARSTTSAVLSYLTIAALSVGTLILFGLALTATTQEVRYAPSAQPAPSVPTGPDGEPLPGYDTGPGPDATTTIVRPDRVWPVLAPNPFVVLADAAPRRPPTPPREIRDSEGNVYYAQDPTSDLDPLGTIGHEVRRLRLAPPLDAEGRVPYDAAPDVREGGPVWYVGLAVDLLLAACAFLLTVRRLRVPSRRLPRGVRVA